MNVRLRTGHKGALVLGALLFAACGQTVRPLSIHDSRLPLEARRWVADADDAVTVAVAWRDGAREALEATIEWRARSVVPVQWPASPEAVAAQSALSSLAEARIRLARQELALAQAELSLAETRRIQVNAETAVRYDLRTYDLEPLAEATRVARGRVEAEARGVRDQRLAVEEATTSWWQSYQAYVSAGGDARVLWVSK
jgi:hypothetical protein